MHKVWEFLKSRKLAITLLPVFIIPLVIGALFQQLSYIFSSWWFVVLSLALFLNTLFCTASRIRSAWIATFREAPKASSTFIKDLKNHDEITLASSVDEAVARVKRALILRRYRLREEAVSGGVSIFAERGRFGVWGSVLFHLSLLLIFLSVLFGAATNLRGRFVLTEGQTFTEQHQDYLEVREAPFFREDHQMFQVRLNKLHLTFDKKGELTNYTSDVVVFDEGEEIERQRIAVNNPLSYKGFVFYQSARYGFSPLLVIEDSYGRELLRAYVSLNRVEGKGKVEFKDSFTVPGTALRVKAQYYPNTKVLRLEVSDGQKGLFKGHLSLNQSANFDGLALTFGGVRYWSDFLVTKDQGIPIVFTGFWLAVIALAVRFLLSHKRVWVFIKEDKGKVVAGIGGTSDRHKALFAAEFGKIVGEIEKTQNAKRKTQNHNEKLKN